MEKASFLVISVQNTDKFHMLLKLDIKLIIWRVMLFQYIFVLYTIEQCFVPKELED